MQKLNIIFAQLIFSAIFFFLGCGDSDPISIDPPLANNFYPLTTDGYSIIRSANLGENNSEIAGTERVDSLVWGKPGTISGASGRPEFSFHADGTIDTNYISNADNKAHWLTLPIALDGFATADLQRRWVKVGDFGGATSWTIIDDTVKNMQIINDTNLFYTARVTKTAIKGGIEGITYDTDKTIQAQKFTFTTHFSGTVKKDSTLSVPLEFSTEESVYFAQNTGFVHSIRDFKNIEIESVQFPLYGFKRTLMRTSVK